MVGRNDLCPCRSGKKFKKCHLRSSGGRYAEDEARAEISLDGILAAARPVFGETGWREFPLMLAATGFIVRFRNESWVATAHHAMANHQLSEQQLRIPRNVPRSGDVVSGDSFMAFHGVLIPNATAFQVPPYWSDFALLRCKRSDEAPFPYVDLDSMWVPDLGSIAAGRIVRTVGFPKAIANSVDYDAKKISLEPFSGDAEFVGRAPYVGVFRARFDPSGFWPSRDLDGMSGSPVFVADDRQETYGFGGILVRAQGLLFEFIAGNVLVTALRSFYSQRG